MPVRSLNSPVLRWPDEDIVIRAVRRWTQENGEKKPVILRMGYFGSYARGDAGVGSDLDILIIVEDTDKPFEQRATEFDTRDLPVPAEVLVYTRAEWEELTGKPGFQRTADQEAIWLYETGQP